MSPQKSKFAYSIFWNCVLITIGSLIQAIALKGIATPHQFVPGGLFGVSSLFYYLSDFLNPGCCICSLIFPCSFSAIS